MMVSPSGKLGEPRGENVGGVRSWRGGAMPTKKSAAKVVRAKKQTWPDVIENPVTGKMEREWVKVERPPKGVEKWVPVYGTDEGDNMLLVIDPRRLTVEQRIALAGEHPRKDPNAPKKQNVAYYHDALAISISIGEWLLNNIGGAVVGYYIGKGLDIMGKKKSAKTRATSDEEDPASGVEPKQTKGKKKGKKAGKGRR